MSEKSKLDDLSNKIDLMLEQKEAKSKSKQNSSEIGFGLSLLTQFASALIVGLSVGFFFDKIFATNHIFLIIFIILGIIAGFLNCYRFEKQYNDKKDRTLGE